MTGKFISGIAIQHDSSLANKWFYELELDIETDDEGNVLEPIIENNNNFVCPHKIANTSLYIG
jgi:hypothetical protein